MKTIIKILVPLLVILAFSFACKKEEDGKGQLKVLLTDDPADFTEVNVNITEVWANYNGSGNSQSGWVQLDANPGFYDLLQLQNGVTDVIADPTLIPTGDINQIRLVLGEDNYAVEIIDSIEVQHPLLLSSQDKTGIKINLNSEIIANQTIEVTLDFDAGSSIIEQGNGEYRLKPVIKVENVTYIP
ncbi:DUF4382 domain-containing protein [Brumimicrobium mesophilum]|uniref:DUF4382 domain-containing protein n=1 Tax=Brumimicrobium mesophilum TaxID=392717 RepID=UPI000D140141|nr:DUF4382 domain-containing protein [Brumimicrobium mesophilum]